MEPLAYCAECRSVFVCPPVCKCDLCGSNQVRPLPRDAYELGLAAGREIASKAGMLAARVS